MRVLALDYGSARCGCAISDPTGMLATPLDTIVRPSTRRGFARVVALVTEREARRVVVGLPLGLSGRDTQQTRESRAWAARLEAAIDAPVELYDERFTTAIANRRAPGHRGGDDALAAAVLLEDWLARHPGDEGGG